MPMNRIQFQPGLSMPEFFEQYGSESRCEAALERLAGQRAFAVLAAVRRRIVYQNRSQTTLTIWCNGL